MPKNRGREKLIQNLTQLSDDLLQAKAEVDLIKSQFSDGLVELPKVSVCHNDLSGYMQDFFEELEVFKQDSLSQGQMASSSTAASFSTSSPTLESTQSSQANQPAQSSGTECNMAEILQRLENLETETASVKADNHKLLQHASEVDDNLESLHKKHRDTKAQVAATALTVFGETAVMPSMDFPTACQQLTAVQEEMKSFHVKVDKEIAERKAMVREETTTLRKSIAVLQDQVAATNSKVDENTKSLDRHGDELKQALVSVHEMGAKTTQMDSKIEKVATKTDELVKLRRILNHVHLKMQKKLDLETWVQCLEQGNNTLKITFDKEIKTLKSDVKVVQNSLKQNIDNMKKSIKDGTSQNKTQIDILRIQVDNMEKTSAVNKVLFKALTDSSDELCKDSFLETTSNKLVNVGKGLLRNARFKAPTEGFYFVGLNVHQNGCGAMEIAVWQNERCTQSGLAVRTSRNEDRGSTTSILKLAKGDELSVRVCYLKDTPSFGLCVLHGFRIC